MLRTARVILMEFVAGELLKHAQQFPIAHLMRPALTVPMLTSMLIAIRLTREELLVPEMETVSRFVHLRVTAIGIGCQTENQQNVSGLRTPKRETLLWFIKLNL